MTLLEQVRRCRELAKRGADISHDEPNEYKTLLRFLDLAALEAALALLSESKQAHHECEDRWYSCPKADGGCADDRRGPECDCGADEWNAKVDAALAEARAK